VEGGWCSGVGVGTYTKHDVAEVYASYNRCVLDAYPNVPRSSTVFGPHRAYQYQYAHVVIYSFIQSTTVDWGQEDEGQIQYVINRLVQKLIREHLRHRTQDDAREKNREVEISDETITIVRGATQQVYAEGLAKVRNKKYTSVVANTVRQPKFLPTTRRSPPFWIPFSK
jgi:hypothetical protein